MKNETWRLGLALMSMLAFAGCAVDPAEESSPAPEAEQTRAQQSSASEFPPGARVVNVDRSLSLEEALAVLAQGTDDKAIAVDCLDTPYALQSNEYGFYVTVDLDDDNLLKARRCEPERGCRTFGSASRGTRS
jgi:hypothetical protein